MTFVRMVNEAARINDSLLCVGLDPDPAKLPSVLSKEARPIFAFNREIIDHTAHQVCAYKLQIAYFAAVGAEEEVTRTIAYIHDTYPGIPVILDAKRGDIGSTAEMYAREAFERYNADALTVNPYMGHDSMQPYLSHANKGVVILCRTSNPGGADLQTLCCEKEGPLYQVVARRAVREWNANGNVALVVGATCPDELAAIRAITGDMLLLIPGVGAQGGSVQEAVEKGQNQHGGGIMINSSRGIIYASKGPDFARAASGAAETLRLDINRYRRRSQAVSPDEKHMDT
jgi:orotidine-5'-phosphate decarboxylase